ncbi:hypothetical protein GF339_20935 [candidate division KSB3 bacterium]|uniref:Roadblock/LAMTOR2 domain-containing protein n=1 Tax=candidate division KSB3 bacterium TaxID=2044937 RepID=A0A9D5JZW2_9BACT|nr:hypothetical protein [candidate division KSB3 bacterium]MBD3327065.1 hypothetical protein [candidate division KSB3 bacterium]
MEAKGVLVSTESTTEQLQGILQELQVRIEGLEEIAVIQRDGTLLASFFASTHQQNTTVIATEFANLTDEICHALGQSTSAEAIMKGEKRFLAIYKTQDADIFLGILGSATVNFGLLNSGCRIAIQKIHDTFSR